MSRRRRQAAWAVGSERRRRWTRAVCEPCVAASASWSRCGTCPAPRRGERSSRRERWRGRGSRRPGSLASRARGVLRIEEIATLTTAETGRRLGTAADRRRPSLRFTVHRANEGVCRLEGQPPLKGQPDRPSASPRGSASTSLHRAKLRRPATAGHYVRRSRLLDLFEEVVQQPADAGRRAGGHGEDVARRRVDGRVLDAHRLVVAGRHGP